LADFSDITKRLERLEKYLSKDAPRIIGVEAVNHFKESFENEGFTDRGLKKWKDVKRRDSNSGWHGFQYGRKNNFSQAATKRPILSGQTQELKESIKFKIRGLKVTVSSSKKYSQIHNEGGNMKVFGKAKTKMPKRQFIGHSKKLEAAIHRRLRKDITKILS